MEKGGEIWYYHYDGHGSTRLLADGAGGITDRYAYDAYGNLLQKEVRGAYEITSLPEELVIIQRGGNSGYLEIVPNAGMIKSVFV